MTKKTKSNSLYSMTGFGTSANSSKSGKVTVEIKSVNNRFLEINFRMPHYFQSLEDDIRKVIAQNIKRGSVTIFVDSANITQKSNDSIINIDVAKSVIKELSQLVKGSDLESFSTGDVLSIPGVLNSQKKLQIDKSLSTLALKSVKESIANLVLMREKEGNNIRKDLLKRIKLIASKTKQLKTRIPIRLKVAKEKLETRIEKLIDKHSISTDRLAAEVTILVDRLDISEEITRIDSHITLFTDAINNGGEVGKKLNFIVQELNREANTIGSKANDSKISVLSMEIKEELERIREQILNIL